MSLLLSKVSNGARRTFNVSDIQSWRTGACERYMSLRCPGSFPPMFTPLPLCAISAKRQNEIAIIDHLGKHSYNDLLLHAVDLSKRLTAITNKGNGEITQAAILVPSDYRFVVCQWAAWLSNLCTVPLHKGSPEALLDYYINDSQSKLVVVAECLRQRVTNVGIARKNLIVLPDQLKQSSVTESKLFVSNEWNIKNKLKNQNAQIVYTSGTTGPPKGVVGTHFQLHAQFTAVASEWFLNPEDTVLHHLPLNHTHGIINGLLAPLYAGAKVEMLPKFSPKEVWTKLLSEDCNVNVLMGVPTMYAKLISYAEENFLQKKSFIRDFLRLKLRLCTCGSASLPDPILNAWKNLTGHMLLERYGMSEFGMALGNPLSENSRTVGYVGQPFPGIRVRIANRDAYAKNGFKVLLEGDRYSVRSFEFKPGESGHLLVKGPQMFRGYFNKPEETKKSFTADGWFITGDIATYDGNAFKILGRNSVDIIKSGGYKISALDVERVLLKHSNISESIVFGIPDSLYGEAVVAVVVASDNLTLSQVQNFCRNSLPQYSIPTKLVLTERIHRNSLGKVNKVELRKKLFPTNGRTCQVV